MRKEVLPLKVRAKCCNVARASLTGLDSCRCKHAGRRAQPGAPVCTQAATASEACVRYSAEARRLQPQQEGDALAVQFDTLHAALERICAQ